MTNFEAGIGDPIMGDKSYNGRLWARFVLTGPNFNEKQEIDLRPMPESALAGIKARNKACQRFPHATLRAYALVIGPEMVDPVLQGAPVFVNMAGDYGAVIMSANGVHPQMPIDLMGELTEAERVTQLYLVQRGYQVETNTPVLWHNYFEFAHYGDQKYQVRGQALELSKMYGTEGQALQYVLQPNDVAEAEGTGFTSQVAGAFATRQISFILYKMVTAYHEHQVATPKAAPQTIGSLGVQKAPVPAQRKATLGDDKAASGTLSDHDDDAPVAAPAALPASEFQIALGNQTGMQFKPAQRPITHFAQGPAEICVIYPMTPEGYRQQMAGNQTVAAGGMRLKIAGIR